MNKKIKKLIDNFKVKTENGKVFTILKYQDSDIDAEAFQQEPQEIPGIISFITPDGKGVNQINENTYQLFIGADVVMAPMATQNPPLVAT